MSFTGGSRWYNTWWGLDKTLLNSFDSIHSTKVCRPTCSKYWYGPKLGTVRPSLSPLVHVRSLHIYEYFMVAIISTEFIMILYAVSHKMISCSFRRVIWLLTPCFKLLTFYNYTLLFSSVCIYNRYILPFSISIQCWLSLLPNRKFKL